MDCHKTLQLYHIYKKKQLFSFEILQKDSCGARTGRLKVDQDEILTPIFMPVGTAAAVKAVTVEHLKMVRAQIILANSYHLFLQPGSQLIKKLGGIHKFMNWHKPCLTDSGGYQVFSLPQKEITADGVRFKNHKTGDTIYFTPESVIEIQNEIGSNIMMPLDHCINSTSSYLEAKEAHIRTLDWAQRSLKAHTKGKQALFGIAQGCLFKDLRIESIKQLADMDFDGYALGGLAVGETQAEMQRVLNYSVQNMPENKPRYVMGIGTPEDLLLAIEAGTDMFDCTIPTKHARSGVFFTYGGKLRIKSSKYKTDKYLVDTKRYSYTSQHYSRAYLHHLFKANEILGATLASIHNLHFYLHFCAGIRKAIANNSFSEFKKEFLARYNKKK